MKTTKLISGVYAPKDAKEMLDSIIESKINFHKLKSLSSFVRLSVPDSESESIIEDLKKAREQILGLIQEAANEKSSMKIEATIDISVKADNEPEEIGSKEEDLVSINNR